MPNWCGALKPGQTVIGPPSATPADVGAGVRRALSSVRAVMSDSFSVERRKHPFPKQRNVRETRSLGARVGPRTLVQMPAACPPSPQELASIAHKIDHDR